MKASFGHVFPDLPASEILVATYRMWDASGPLPVPRPGWLRCPICGTERPQPRYWELHQRTGDHAVFCRCDVSFKCVLCAYVWVHGVALDEETWTRMRGQVRRHRRSQIGWREAKTMLENYDG